MQVKPPNVSRLLKIRRGNAALISALKDQQEVLTAVTVWILHRLARGHEEQSLDDSDDPGLFQQLPLRYIGGELARLDDPARNNPFSGV